MMIFSDSATSIYYRLDFKYPFIYFFHDFNWSRWIWYFYDDSFMQFVSNSLNCSKLVSGSAIFKVRLYIKFYADSFGRKISKIRSGRNVIWKFGFTKNHNSMSHYRIAAILVSKVLEFIRDYMKNKINAPKYRF